ncbi:CASP-like protein 1F3 [Hibiscus syriacus]|uniref:CASP-like protein n=1 Tax=Hibiscus syriacus TaxID=106335 RepID=A0A6A2ZRL9_HIBSY|nr:CASP-like protein 1F2 [Hibiscus syriacus]KAE8694420.1 CASP-like protein 1F3 [Hibiscus syriacus]
MLQAKCMAFPLSKSSKRNSFIAQITLRVFAAAFTLAAICVMTTSSQSILLLGFNINAHYSDSSALRFLLVTDSIVCAFSVLSVLFVYGLSRLGSDVKYQFCVFLHDMVIMGLAISGCAAATAVGYISRYGEDKMGWMAVCNHVGKLCNRMMISMVFSYLAFFSYFALSLMSGNKLMYE